MRTFERNEQAAKNASANAKLKLYGLIGLSVPPWVSCLLTIPQFPIFLPFQLFLLLLLFSFLTLFDPFSIKSPDMREKCNKMNSNCIVKVLILMGFLCKFSSIISSLISLLSSVRLLFPLTRLKFRPTKSFLCNFWALIGIQTFLEFCVRGNTN